MLRSEWTCWEDALDVLQEREQVCGPHPYRETFHTLGDDDFWTFMAKCHYGTELTRREHERSNHARQEHRAPTRDQHCA